MRHCLLQRTPWQATRGAPASSFEACALVVLLGKGAPSSARYAGGVDRHRDDDGW